MIGVRRLVVVLVLLAAVAGAAGVLLLGGGSASADKGAATAANTTEVVVEFPTGGPVETAWKVHWAQATSRGLYITGAWFKRGPAEPWTKVLGDTRVSDIFVPYHGHKYPGFESTRFWDLSTSSYAFELMPATQADAGPHGQLLGDPPLVVKEVRDRGVIWKDSLTGRTRRGQELVLWGTLKAANYAYIMQYGFRDDGVVACRIGATSRNYPSAPLESHVHNAMWRIDIDVDGPDHNTPYLMMHKSPRPGGHPAQCEDRHVLFNGGKEGYADWKPEEFTMLHVVNRRRTNIRGEHRGYDLMPIRMGTGRAYGGGYEDCTLHDFYVTRSPHADGKPDTELDFKLLLTKYINGESIENTDVVLWYLGSMHHEPRSEDGKFVRDKEGNYYFEGVTHVMWGGFDLVPRNFFDQTPLFPYGE
jgi:hypothetical protein